ncbi:hypothetical protein L6164_022582 [Bauhinia variegata]|uniref:Uncharacterized protein n=1 Tax=Bauhinia variegata TaxID=167791 RepID=A0ACB9MFH1_BAUVA|nr:hypothetical protein L6164_022582 [Bauhinia variegata]
MLNFQASAQPSQMDNNMVPRISVSRPLAPPLVSFIAALSTVMLIMWVSAFSTMLSLAIVLVLYIIYVSLCWFVHEIREFDIEMGQRFQNPENNQRVSEFVDRFSWVLEERGRQGQQEYSKELFGSVVCFGSHGMPSGCSDCAICLDDFEKVINDVLLSWTIDQGQSQSDVEAGETIQLRQSDNMQSDNEPFIEETAIHENVTLIRVFWMDVLDRYRTEYLEEEEEQKQRLLDMLSPQVKYRRQGGLYSCDECVICLDDFVDGDSCRVFPVCKHNFHLDCIDRWLKNGQATCPICRRYILDECKI